jgi:hypothetical protein
MQMPLHRLLFSLPPLPIVCCSLVALGVFGGTSHLQYPHTIWASTNLLGLYQASAPVILTLI